jgi:hypothetical protein
VLTLLVQEGGDPPEIVERDRLGAIAVEPGGLAELVEQAIATVEQVRATGT